MARGIGFQPMVRDVTRAFVQLLISAAGLLEAIASVGKKSARGREWVVPNVSVMGQGSFI